MSSAGINACWERDRVLFQEATLRNNAQADSSAKLFCDRQERNRRKRQFIKGEGKGDSNNKT